MNIRNFFAPRPDQTQRWALYRAGDGRTLVTPHEPSDKATFRDADGRTIWTRKGIYGSEAEAHAAARES